MASIFGHGFSAIVFAKLYKKKAPKKDFLLFSFSAFCAIMPDFDVISFNLGIPYSSPLGHRGLTHSFIFAFIIGFIISTIYRRIKIKSEYKFWPLTLYFSFCTASHGILDALTSGGKGVGFFIPFDNARYFFPFRPIQVSPLGIEKFMSKWGLEVLLSEVIWIGIPGIILLILNAYFRK